MRSNSRVRGDFRRFTAQEITLALHGTGLPVGWRSTGTVSKDSGSGEEPGTHCPQKAPPQYFHFHETLGAAQSQELPIFVSQPVQKVVKSPPLAVFKICVDVALEDIFSIYTYFTFPILDVARTLLIKLIIIQLIITTEVILTQNQVEQLSGISAVNSPSPARIPKER